MPKRICSFLVALFLIMVVVSSAQAAIKVLEKGETSAYLLVIDKLSIHDLDQQTTPHLVSLLRKGSLGLQSNRTLGSGSSEDGCLTIGAGNLARSTNKGLLGMNGDEMVPQHLQTAAQLYENLTGNQTDGNKIFLVNLPEVWAGMQEEHVSTQLGALGKLLADNGIRTCVLGNGDINGKYDRSAVGLAMDEKGRVFAGDVGPSVTRADENSFVTTCTNYDYLKKNLFSLAKGSRLVVIELSDLARLENADIAAPEIEERERQRILGDIDDFCGWLLSTADNGQNLIMVLSPSSSADEIKNKDTFTPLIIKGPGFKEGYLTSGATKRPYIVANTDIAPTILRYFGISDKNGLMVGRPILSKTTRDDTLARACDIADKAALTNRLRAPLVKGYVLLQIVVIALSLICLLLAPTIKKWIIPLVWTLVIVPLLYLFLGALKLEADWQYMAVSLLITVVATALSWLRLKDKPYILFFILSLFTLAALDTDVLLGSHFIQSSVLGYDPMAGARYYGIGNEYLGILIGTSIIVAVEFYQMVRKRWALVLVALFFVFQSCLLAAPAYGAQSDGVITAPVAFLVAFVLMGDYHLRPRTIILLSVIVVAAVGMLIAYDMSRPLEMQSHIGRAASQISQQGLGQGVTIVARKMGMNLKLIRFTIWSRVFLVILASLIVLLYRPAGLMAQAKRRHPYLFKGFAGILTGAVVGGIVNDSGIVTAATTSIYVVTPMIILMLEQIDILADGKNSEL